MCATYHLTTKEPILIFRGERGYTPIKDPSSFDAEEFNKSEGITENQVRAMLHGSMFGWETPGADPDFYEASGLTKRQELELDIKNIIESYGQEAPLLMVKSICEFITGRFYDLDKAIANPWYIDDVKSIREDLSDEQAMQVLENAYLNYDAEIGINWEVLKSLANELFPDPELQTIFVYPTKPSASDD